jgi:uncharacterized protein YcnI
MLTLALALSFLFAPLAPAHVTVTPKTATSGGYAKLTFRVPHGCDGSATTGITVKIPDGVVAVKPQVHPGWKITVKKAHLAQPYTSHGQSVSEAVTEVSWTGGPLDDAYMDEFGLSVKLPDRPGERLLFPVHQKCKKGAADWAMDPGMMHGEHGEHAGHGLPAPVVTLEGKAKG